MSYALIVLCCTIPYRPLLCSAVQRQETDENSSVLQPGSDSDSGFEFANGFKARAVEYGTMLYVVRYCMAWYGAARYSSNLTCSLPVRLGVQKHPHPHRRAEVYAQCTYACTYGTHMSTIQHVRAYTHTCIPFTCMCMHRRTCI